MSEVKKIGITGGIGSGKSIICRVFAVLGAPVYDADSRAKWLMVHDALLVEQIVQLFGSQSYREGALNREYLASRVFTNQEDMDRLNALVHPSVARDFEAWCGGQTFPYILKEAALLFETGSYRQMNKVVLVTAPESVRTQRVLARDAHRKARDVEAIMRKQWSDDIKAAQAYVVLNNDGRKLMLPQILELHQSFLR